MLPPNVSTSSNGTNDAISSAARHNSAFTGKLSPDEASFESKSDNFMPPGLPVNIDTGSAGISVGVVFKPAQDDSSKAVPKLNDNIRPKQVNLQIRWNIVIDGSYDFVACATMQIGREFVKKKGRGKPLPLTCIVKVSIRKKLSNVHMFVCCHSRYLLTQMLPEGLELLCNNRR